MEWRPIETAPKDGTWILLWCPMRNCAIGGNWHSDPGTDTPDAFEPPWEWWVADEDYVMWDDGTEPTHWMPLPEAPR